MGRRGTFCCPICSPPRQFANEKHAFIHLPSYPVARLVNVCVHAHSAHPKIEYMVAAFDDQEKNVKLSLRQTEILAKLQSIVSDIASDRGET